MTKIRTDINVLFDDRDPGFLQYSFDKSLTTDKLIKQGSAVLVAVSGGVDSVVLLHLLSCTAPAFGLTIGVAHYNHGMRAEASDDDEAFVKELANSYGLDCFSGKLPRNVAHDGESWEAYARRHRYHFLENEASAQGFSFIATAHHANDQAETVLMRMMDGAGVRGMGGIHRRRGRIVRPLLPFTKEQILTYAREQELSWREDQSNSDTRFRRNRIRHEVLPPILKSDPDFIETASRLADEMRSLENLLRAEVENLKTSLVSKDAFGRINIQTSAMAALPMEIQKRLMHQIVEADAPESPWRHHQWLRLEEFLTGSKTGQVLCLPCGWRMLRDRDRFILAHENGDRGEACRFAAERAVSVVCGDYRFQMDVTAPPAQFTADRSKECVDFRFLENRTLELRMWQPGDRMKPLGLKGFKKVSDLLIDKKIDRFRKEQQTVLTVDGKLAWLCGVQLDDRFKVTSRTDKMAQLTWAHV